MGLDPITATLGASVISGAIGSRNQRKAQSAATSAQVQAQREAIEAQERAQEQLREDLAPYSGFGQSNIDALQTAINQGPAQLDPNALSNPLLRSIQEDMQQRILSNRAARGALGTGGTGVAVTQALAPMALNFALGQQQTENQQRQQNINNLLAAVGMGQRSAAGVGASGVNTASNIGNIQQNIGSTVAQGSLNQASSQNQMLGSVLGAGSMLASRLGQGGGGTLYQPTVSNNNVNWEGLGL